MTLCTKNFLINMLIEVDLTLPDLEHPKDLCLEAKRLCFAGGFAGCVAWTLDQLTGWDEMGWAWCWPVDPVDPGKDTVDGIAAVAAAEAIHCTEIQATWLVKHRDQSAVQKEIRCLHFKLTLRSSNTVHVPVHLIGSNILLLRNKSRTSHCNLSKNWNSSPNEIH